MSRPAIPTATRDGETDAEYVARLAGELEAEFQRLGPGTVIAFIAETVVGATLGCAAPLPGYFPAMRAVCDRHGALLILDEVMCGMGRTGVLHAWEAEDVTPDIQVVAKGLGGGYQPIGGILAHRRVVEGLASGSGAFRMGTPTSAPHRLRGGVGGAAGDRARTACSRTSDAMGARLEARLSSASATIANIGEIRGRGLFWAVEFVRDRATKEPFDPALKLHERVKREAFARGLACYPMGGTIDGRRGDHAILAPPYIVDAAQIDTVVERFGDAVEAALMTAQQEAQA